LTGAFNNSTSSHLLSQSQPSTPTFTNSSLITNTLTSPQTSSNVVGSSLTNYVANTVSALFSTQHNKLSESTTSLDFRCAYFNNASRDFTSFFEKSLPLHRILYHLEALSSRLMPASIESSTNQQQAANLFQQDFLKANGLEVLIKLLELEDYQKIGFNTTSEKKTTNQSTDDKDIETKQDIYILLLQLLRLIFFGSYYPLNNTINSNKRPSTEPITTLAKKCITPSMVDLHNNSNSSYVCAGASSNGAGISSVQAFAYRQSEIASSSAINENDLIQAMSVGEVADLVMQLMTIFWAAAAGNLQLAYLKK